MHMMPNFCCKWSSYGPTTLLTTGNTSSSALICMLSLCRFTEIHPSLQRFQKIIRPRNCIPPGVIPAQPQQRRARVQGQQRQQRQPQQQHPQPQQQPCRGRGIGSLCRDVKTFKLCRVIDYGYKYYIYIKLSCYFHIFKPLFLQPT